MNVTSTTQQFIRPVFFFFLFFLVLQAHSETETSSDPSKRCASNKEWKEENLCRVKLWCTDCGLNTLKPSEYTLHSSSLSINTNRLIQFGKHTGTGRIHIYNIMQPTSDNLELCPTDGGYLIVEGYKTTECVPYPFFKSLGLEVSPGLKKLLKTFSFDSVSFTRSNGLNKGRKAPYTLLIASLRIKKGQTVCGIKFDEDTVATLNTFENDHKIAIRPPKPIVIGGKTYPAWADDSQVYEIFDGEKCATEIRFLKASD